MTDRPGAPTILALDFDGVLCEGSREYFETSRRTYARVWPDGPAPGEALYPTFRDLRPVIETGWEMPVLVKAIVDRVPRAEIEGAWAPTRDRLVGDGAARRVVVDRLKTTLDGVRREWIAADRLDWLGRHALYVEREELRGVVGEPERTVVVTTKEGEFAREILTHWGVEVAGIQGKEAGAHKCENLRQLLAEYQAAQGRPASLWFVEDRLETLQCVTTHPDLARIGLFLAAWGYNTEATRASVHPGDRIRLLTLERFRRGPSAWETA